MHGLYVSQAFLCQSLHHTSDYGRPPAGSIQQQQPLLNLLARVHEDIITFWNFMDEKNVRYLWDVMGHILTRFPVRSSAAKSFRDSFSSLSKTPKNHGIRIGLTPCRMCLCNGV